MTNQALIKSIESRIKQGQSPLVILSLEEWHQIEDIIEELSSPRLLKDIKKARDDYKKRKAVEYKSLN
ncbi:MAG: hypothetical protein A2817_01615 [Candidatus Yanofskybacteria bacterium RIFCSPHIGHO2_01_FULL_39_8b]|uniref:Antitoxin n=1 Tax=Candidatus Yanofskybacteria bacterium RIFCSPHIGHO2_01_FULL_39_8b TaxID=1802659 RepID=A0A1F8EFG3_9BACT|nr:MAG: hypothetical protein A2817_01615 [Candidatus Yanofskybacteria bacterium RIFCSPHIGHO2_01_FULL_39_8b]